MGLLECEFGQAEMYMNENEVCTLVFKGEVNSLPLAKLIIVCYTLFL